MKPTYNGFEAKKTSGYAQLPPVGAYVAEIQGVKTEQSYDGSREEIICMVEIIEGEYAGQYHKVFEDQKAAFGDNIKYRGVLRIRPFVDGDDAWVRSRFEQNLWCVQESNPGYAWDWDEKKLKGKKVGINVRKNVYTGRDGQEKETTEIAQFETVEDVREGKVRTLKPRISRRAQSDSEAYTNVTAEVDVPF